MPVLRIADGGFRVLLDLLEPLELEVAKELLDPGGVGVRRDLRLEQRMVAGSITQQLDRLRLAVDGDHAQPRLRSSIVSPPFPQPRSTATPGAASRAIASG